MPTGFTINLAGTIKILMTILAEQAARLQMSAGNWE
jgi:hypothetical protein